MSWGDIPRWEKMTSAALAEEAGFPADCDAIYVNNCYELSYVPTGGLAEMDRKDYAELWDGAVFKMLFQVHYEFLDGCFFKHDPPWRRKCQLHDWEPGGFLPYTEMEPTS